MGTQCFNVLSIVRGEVDNTVSSVESDTITTYRSQTLSSGTASSGDRWFGSVEELGQFLGC